MFGKNIIITDNTDWPTGDIVQASLDRWQVEDRFRLTQVCQKFSRGADFGAKLACAAR
jgi:hypothetical protein